MTLKNKYDEIMEKVEVTPEMSERILKNISEIDIKKQSSKTLYFKNHKRILSIAACFVVLLAGAFIFPKIMNSAIPPLIQEIPDIKACKSVSELSSVLGFEVSEPNYLPFDFTQKAYNAYWKEVAEITYTNENNIVTFRMAQGSKDISGDYNEYNEVKDFQMDFGTITLKGNDGAYNLAIWSHNDMSYSIETIEPIFEDLILNIARSVSKFN